MSKAIRDAVAETSLSPRDFIVPVFVKEGISRPEPIDAMPGYYRLPTEGDELVKFVQESMELGLKAFLFFGVTGRKGRLGETAYDPTGPVQRAVRYLRRELGWEPLIFADLCLCGYTDHGHCGIPVEKPRGMVIDNDMTIEIYGKIAVSLAEAGVDFVAPSGMMDGQVKAIREALDNAGYGDVGIMSYAVKYASGFYGPFREAASSAPRFGDRRSYQMDPRNKLEAIKEALMDVEEGADILMVKPALAYLDVVSIVKQHVPYMPLAAYNVSGEYSMVKVAAREGLIDERLVVMEILTAIKRAGADLIITYHAREAAKWIREGYDPF
jgi:porphobilinogen synthase